MATPTPTRYELGRQELSSWLGDVPRYRTDQVWTGLYGRLATPAEMTDLPRSLRQRVADELPPALEVVTDQSADGGATRKWLFALGDGRRIETVLMAYRNRSTVCVSSQAGCAMGCGFCATGQAGFDRNLTTGEIVEQVARAARTARDDGGRLSNVVFMGMGEAFANYDRAWAAIQRIHGDLGLSARHLTLSTVGLVPGIRRLAGENLPVSLAVSLHAADDELRDELVPINRRHPLVDLEAACRTYLAAKRRRLSFEWAMIDGINDTVDQAERLAGLATSLRAHVNLIPLNHTPGSALAPSPPGAIAAFADRLRRLGVNVTVRANRGTDIDAACGQLAADHRVAAPARRPTLT